MDHPDTLGDYSPKADIHQALPHGAGRPGALTQTGSGLGQHRCEGPLGDQRTQEARAEAWACHAAVGENNK